MLARGTGVLDKILCGEPPPPPPPSSDVLIPYPFIYYF